MVVGFMKCPTALGAMACPDNKGAYAFDCGFTPLIPCPCVDPALPLPPRLYIKSTDAKVRGITSPKVITYTSGGHSWCYTVDPQFVTITPPDSTLIDITNPITYPLKDECFGCYCCDSFIIWTTNWVDNSSLINLAQGTNQPWSFTLTAGVLTQTPLSPNNFTIAGTGPWTITDNVSSFVWTLPLDANGCPDPENLTLTTGVAIPMRVAVSMTISGTTYVADMLHDSGGAVVSAGQSIYQYTQNSFTGPVAVLMHPAAGQYKIQINRSGTIYEFTSNPTDIYGSVDTNVANWTQITGPPATLNSITLRDFFTPQFDHYKCLCLTDEQCCISDGATAEVKITGISAPRGVRQTDDLFYTDDSGYDGSNDILQAANELIANVIPPLDLIKTGTTSAGSCQWLATGDRILPADWRGGLVDDGIIAANILYVPNTHTEGDQNHGIWQAVWQIPAIVGTGPNPDVDVFALTTVTFDDSTNYEHLGHPTALSGGSGTIKECLVKRTRYRWNVDHYEEYKFDIALVDLAVTWTITGNSKHVLAGGTCR